MRFLQRFGCSGWLFRIRAELSPKDPSPAQHYQFRNGNLAPNQQAKNIIANEGYAGLFGHSADFFVFGRLDWGNQPLKPLVSNDSMGVALDFIRFHAIFHYGPSILGPIYGPMDPRHVDSPSPSFRQGRGLKTRILTNGVQGALFTVGAEPWWC